MGGEGVKRVRGEMEKKDEDEGWKSRVKTEDEDEG